ncbi:hypothetical protein GEMRC1_006523 [Eukaryota sp. GEM-RC1]
MSTSILSHALQDQGSIMRCWSYSSACRLTTSLSHAPQDQGSIMRCWSYSSACRLTTSLSHAPQDQGSIMRCWSYSSACRLTTSLSHAPQDQGSIMRCWSYSSACRLTTSLSHAPQDQGSIMRCWSYSSACRLTTSLSHAPQDQGSIMRCWSYSSACRLTTSLSHAPQDQGSIMRCWRIIFVSASETAYVNCVHVLSIIPPTSSRNIPQMILCVVSSSISALCLILRIVFSSRHPFKEDLTADGDIESNPGPISESALQTLLPDEWIDDEVIDQYCLYLLKLHNYPVECFISPILMLHNAVDTTTQQFDVVLLTKFIIQQLTNNGYCRYFIAPVINNTGTRGYHWGLLIIDCRHRKWLFIDPNYDTNDFYLDEENVECPSGSFNVFLSTVNSALSVLEYRPIIVPVTQKQTPND